MRPLLSLLFCLSLATAAPVALADDDKEDHERARAALERGEILPLRAIVEKAEAAYPGRLLEVELKSKKEGFVYEIEVLAPDGRLIELVYDARDGSLLKAKGAGKDLLKSGEGH